MSINIDPNTTIFITTENGRLFAMATGEPRFEIFPLSPTTFLVKELNAKITFLRAPDGTISKLIVDMAGQKKDAPKINKPAVNK